MFLLFEFVNIESEEKVIYINNRICSEMSQFLPPLWYLWVRTLSPSGLLTRSSGGANGKESTCQCRRSRINPWVGKIPWKREWQPTPVFLPGKSHGQRSLVSYTPWDHEQLDTTEWLHTHTHTHTHTLKIPAIEFRSVYYLVSLILPDRMIWDKFGTTQGSSPSIF